MAENQDGQEKTEEPTQHRIDEFRKKGEVASSKEVNSLLILTGAFGTLFLSSFFIFEQFHLYFDWILKQNPQQIFFTDQLSNLVNESALVFIKCILPVLAVSFCLGIIAQVAQVGLIYAPEVLQLKWERLDPIKGAKRIFSLRAIFEVFKGLFKFSIILGLTYFLLGSSLGEFRGFLHSELVEGFGHISELILKLFLSLVSALLIVAAADFSWEKFRYKQRLRMTKQEVKEEQKQKDGNPEIRQRIRQIQREMSRKRMMQDVSQADAIVTNPTHYSVAIKYELDSMAAPVVVAKGVDELAFKIRKVAQENDIPLVENKLLARGLYKDVEVGNVVPRDYYHAVAEVLAFVYRLRKKKKQGIGVRA